MEIDGDFDGLKFMTDVLPADAFAIISEPENPYGNKKDRFSFVEQQKQRTKQAAIAVINLMEATQNSPALGTVRFQILKSSTSTAANYRAACRARSKNEFFAKMSIVVEEADETVLWLEFLKESTIKIDKQEVTKLLNEWDQIMRMMATARKNIHK